MALITEEQLRMRIGNEISKGGHISESNHQKAERILSRTLTEQRTFSERGLIYDIFLSHSSKDVKLVIGLMLTLEDMGYSIYVDWIEDPHLDRNNVTKDNVLILKSRMHQSKSLIYAFSENATHSQWMPWELGYFDGYSGKVSVLPISTANKQSFIGTEYLRIYYYCDFDNAVGKSEPTLWVCESQNKYITYNSWLKGQLPYKR